MVIVDTTVWIDYLKGTSNGHTIWLDRQLDRQRLGLTDLILCEVLQGIREEAVFTEVRQDLVRFRVFNTGGEDLAVAAANNYRFLQGQGYTVRRMIDCLIATFCLEERHSLLHRDHDFDPFERILALQVVHP